MLVVVRYLDAQVLPELIRYATSESKQIIFAKRIKIVLLLILKASGKRKMLAEVQISPAAIYAW